MANAPGGLDLRAGQRLRGQLLRIVCSRRWEDDLYQHFSDSQHGRLYGRWGGGQKKTERLLASSRLYPPGGSRSLMRHCKGPCGHWTPPQATGSANWCYECYVERDLPADVTIQVGEFRLTLTASAFEAQTCSMPSAGRLDRDQSREALGAGLVRVRRRGSRPWQPREGVHWYGQRRAGLAMLARADRLSRSNKRRLYLANDARVGGAPIDAEGMMRDPWLGYLPWLGFAYPPAPPKPVQIERPAA